MKPLRVLFALGLPAFVSGVLGEAPALVRQSPFAGGTLVGSHADGPALELRGILSGAAGTRYWIYDRASRTGTWATVGESGLPFVIRAEGPGAETATVEKDGRVAFLRLEEPKVSPEPEAPSTQNPPGPPEPSYVMTRRLPGEPRAPGTGAGR